MTSKNHTQPDLKCTTKQSPCKSQMRLNLTSSQWAPTKKLLHFFCLVLKKYQFHKTPIGRFCKKFKMLRLAKEPKFFWLISLPLWLTILNSKILQKFWKKLGKVCFVFGVIPKKNQAKRRIKIVHAINFKTDSQPKAIFSTNPFFSSNKILCKESKWRFITTMVTSSQR